MYGKFFHPDWFDYFNSLETDIKNRVSRKISKILEEPHKRHLENGNPCFVSEIGQYRITYMILENEKKVLFYFVGKHKDYEKWYREEF